MLLLDIPEHSHGSNGGHQASSGSSIQIPFDGTYAPLTTGSLAWNYAAQNSICNIFCLIQGLWILKIVKHWPFERVAV